jgi:hypothetical protein
VTMQQEVMSAEGIEIDGWRTLKLCLCFSFRYLAVGAAPCAVFAGCVRAMLTTLLMLSLILCRGQVPMLLCCRCKESMA